MTTKTNRIIFIILLTLVSLMVVMSGVMKLLHTEQMVQNMGKVNLSGYLTLFGLIELVAVTLLIFKRTYKIGFLLLCCYLGGALSIELSGGVFPTAAVLLTLLWIGAYLRDKTHFTTTAA